MKRLVDEQPHRQVIMHCAKYDHKGLSQAPERQGALLMRGRTEPCLKFAGPSHTSSGAGAH